MTDNPTIATITPTIMEACGVFEEFEQRVSLQFNFKLAVSGMFFVGTPFGFDRSKALQAFKVVNSTPHSPRLFEY